MTSFTIGRWMSALMVAVAMFLASGSSASALTINTTESFESGANGWTPTGAFWQTGVPTGGPKAAHTGTKCAAINLTGVYAAGTAGAYSQFVSPLFTVPAASLSPRLTFWQWYSFYAGSASYQEGGYVQVRVSGTTNWVTLSGPFIGDSSDIWSEGAVDLGAYAGKMVQVAFSYLPSNNSGRGTGWYIDDVTVTSGATSFPVNTPQTFESGLGSWTMAGSFWQVGAPAGGPDAAHGGVNCAALNLDGEYPGESNTIVSQLISPTFTVPVASADPRLTFWQYYSFYLGSSTYEETGRVQIRVTGTTNWITLSGPYVGNNSKVWAQGSVDLSAYAGQSVQVAFSYTPSANAAVGSGWFIDDITLVSGAATLAVNTPQTFESGMGAWTMLGSLWQVGKPTSGPLAAHGGSYVAALNLGGSYGGTSPATVSQLVSPMFTVPAASSDPRLTFWQYYSYYWGSSTYEESGTVQVRVAGTANWITLSGPYVGNNSKVWSEGSVDLSAYAGKSVEVSFTYTPSANGATGSGWYLDDITLVSGAATLAVNTAQTFESGLGAWTMAGGLWEVGKPTGGPAAAHAGTACAALNLAGSYVTSGPAVASQLVSPVFTVPAASSDPRLSFWQYYSYYYGSTTYEEKSTVQIRVVGTANWITLSGPYVGANSKVWAQGSVDLSAYAGQSVQVSFTYTPSANGATGSGWYLDDITLVSGAATLAVNTVQTFESGLGAWTMAGGLWQVGKPTGGPAVAHAGTYCAALNLAGSYVGTSPATVSQFVSPTFTVPAATSDPRLTFWQYYSYYSGSSTYEENSTVQIRVAGTSNWVTLTGPYVGSNGPLWTEVGIDLSAYAGKSVQISFTYTPSANAATASGWYIDDITLVSGSIALVPNILDNFESGLGGFTMLGNQWQVGKPTGGPAAAHDGTNCAALNLSGSYVSNIPSTTSRFVTPSFLVPDTTQNPKLNFYHYYSLYNASTTYRESANVSVLVAGTTNWVNLSGPYVGTGTGSWTSVSTSLNSYGGKTVQVAFTYTPSANGATGKGWFIDDVELVAPPKAQTITFPAIAAKTYGVAPFAISATASSKLPVTFTVASGPATISGSTVTITGAGTVSIKASQAGSPYYLAAPTVTNTFTVAKEAQIITFAALAAKTYGNAPFAVSATATSKLPVTFSVASGPATISGSTVTITGAGTVSIKASQAGNTNFLAATSVSQSFTVAKAAQTITFGAIAAKTYSTTPFTLSGTASSGLALTYTVNSGPATVSGSSVTLTGVGTVSITASQAGSTNYNAATSVTQSFTVSKGSQTITFPTIAAKTYGVAPFTLTATASSGLAVTYKVNSGPATVSGSTVTITGAGTVSITASQAGGTNYNAATSVTQSFTVAKAAQTIAAWAPIAPQHYPGSVAITPPKASSGLAVTVTVASGPATLSGNVVTFTGTGTVTLAANQAGDANHLAATAVTTNITVTTTMGGGGG